eukprot:TRINITY_DN4364_c0_g1_i1.p1 TRINITY_DN4364_c0_g1~~TRINITY_DN4364_c0_g1_i1.p1  ORF type:complete len:252 (+),score=29.33 TRINITY_DN4364_c0_g1_i1:76-831(+)
MSDQVRRSPQRPALELVTIDGRVLKAHAVSRPLSKFPTGAATRDRFGFLAGCRPEGMSWDFNSGQVDLLLFDRHLEPVEMVRVFSVDERTRTGDWAHDFFLPAVFNVAESLVVVTQRMRPRPGLAAPVHIAFTVFSASSRVARTVDFPAIFFQGVADALVHGDRLLVCTPGPRVHCFSAGAALLWSYIVPVVTPAGPAMGWNIFGDSNDLFLVGHRAEDTDAHVLRLTHDLPAAAQSQSSNEDAAEPMEMS